MDKRILVVDDEEDILDIISIVISDFSSEVEVVTTSSVNEAFSIIKNSKIHLLITDLQMPEMTGTELIKKIAMLDKSQWPNDIVVLSGLIREKSDFKTGMNIATLSKPFTTEDLAEILVRTIGRPVKDFVFDPSLKNDFVKEMSQILIKISVIKDKIVKQPTSGALYGELSRLMYGVYGTALALGFTDFSDYVNSLHRLFTVSEEKANLPATEKAINFLEDSNPIFSKIEEAINDPKKLNQLSLQLKIDTKRIEKFINELHRRS